jgi:hypothetical protein
MLSDSDSARLIASVAKTVSSLEFKACPLLGMGFCRSISDSFSSKGKLLEVAVENIALKDESIAALLANSSALENLKNINLRRVNGVTGISSSNS